TGSSTGNSASPMSRASSPSCQSPNDKSPTAPRPGTPVRRRSPKEAHPPVPGKAGEGSGHRSGAALRLAGASSRAGGIVCRARQDGCMSAKTRTGSEAPPRPAAPYGARPAVRRAGADPLAGFSALTREWFTGAFTEPTPAQAGAWSSIASGENTLVIAPTGSGKTLAAFLWALDRLARSPVPADPKLRCRVLYISP